ncbi:hypothetical protein EUTSA_v10021284mg [Eutrema salsugineum]|uniref:DUF3082 domain-containing protein n=1 Tax=Eutrema salsugineum TaxID=72664 RepID=V4M0X9_EUTSA|nr:uncharacterized protein LOC18023582 [Eutrema salsugineum]ESQ48467.1 hypothetical protein EUTSA_v10021284mg [Eutrema salsugineum]
MLVLQSHQCLFSSSTSAFSLPHRRRKTRLISLYRPPDSISPIPSLSAFTRIRPDRFRVSALKEIADVADGEEDGPIELPPSSTSPFSSTNSIFATSDEPSPLQLATSVMLTGAITIFLFRSIRRRAKRSKELTFRSSGAKKKSLKEEAMESLKAISSTPIEDGKSTPSAAQAFLGAISAGVIALILYKFTLTIESSLNRQTISDNFSVRQITVTVRTIINGICYLATFVFGINAIGLLLYSGQLAFNEESDDMKATTEPGDSSGNDSEVNKSNEDQSSGD